MIYNYLKGRGIDVNEHEFMNKLEDFVDNYKKEISKHNEREASHPYYMSKHAQLNEFMDVPSHDSNKEFHDKHSIDIEKDSIYNAMRYIDHTISDSSHFSESEANYLVANMCHIEDGRKYTGERYCMRRAKEIYERYKEILPVSVTPVDIYVAINSQYHNYVELFKNWFGNDIDKKIVESAIVFWFKDLNTKSKSKLVKYFKEY